MKSFASIFVLFLFCGSVFAASMEKEYIVVTGGPALIEWEKLKNPPHDRYWGNFVRASRVRIEEIRQKHGDVPITWLVYRRAYVRRGERQDHRDLISLINSVRDKYHVKLVWFNESADVINYLNSGQPRDQVKIANFDYFGHSNRACFMFDYSNEIDSGSKVWLHEDELKQIHRGLFAPGCHIKSWGCYTGEGMSQKWRMATGKKMTGAIGKTDYSTGTLPTVSKHWAF
ncbi:MAG: hypothetical protein ABI615_09070 [Chthoniobacterales bacterium]